MMIRNIKINLYKALAGYGFLLCVLFTVVLCFSSGIYEDFNGDKYSVFRVLTEFDRETLLGNTDFCSFEVARKGVGSWLSLFIPIIAAFPYVTVLCDGYRTGAARFEIFRSTRLRCHASEFLAACLAGGLAVMAGYALFVLAVYFLFPNIHAYPAELRDFYEEMAAYMNPFVSQGGYGTALLIKTGGMFLYGAACAAPAVMFAGITRNKYLALCIPFFLKYAANQTFQRLQSQAVGDYTHIDERLQQICSVINPDALAVISDYGGQAAAMLAYNGLLVLAVGVIYFILQERRCDSGA